MANICSTFYTLTGPVEEIKSLWDVIESMGLEKNPDLENLVHKLGGDVSKIDCCGGYFTDGGKTDDNTALYLSIDSNWCEPVEVHKLIHLIYPNIHFEYISEEPGCGYFATTSKDKNRDRYMMDSSISYELESNLDGSAFTPFKSLRDVVYALRDVFKTNEIKFSRKSIKKFIKKIYKEKEETGEDKTFWFCLSPIHCVNPFRK